LFGDFRFNFFLGGSKAKACTLLLRGGSEQFIAETERSLHDAIMIVRRTKKNDFIVAGECLSPTLSFLSAH
jgi:T-complex protein 1 subunit eta